MNVLTKSKLNTEVTYLKKIGGYWSRIIFIALDVVSITIGGFLAAYIRFGLAIYGESLPNYKWFTFHGNQELRYYIGFLFLNIILTLVVLKSYGIYHTPRGRRWTEEMRFILKALTISSIVVMVSIFLAKIQISRFTVITAYFINILFLGTWRFLYHKLENRYINNGEGLKNVLIIGAGDIGNKLYGYLCANEELGLKVVGFIDDYKKREDILGNTNDLPKIFRKHFIDEIYITIPSERELVKSISLLAKKFEVDIKVIPELYDGVVSASPLSFWYFGDIPVMELTKKTIPEFGLMLKRLIDIISSTVSILVFLPLMLIIAIAIKLDSSDGKIIYASKRVGRKGNLFNFYKFRTMVPNADELKDELRGKNDRSGPFFKMKDDPRITRVGRILRKYKLDELPQFFNVFLGNMSLVGPRPHPIDDFDLYKLDYYKRLDVKPGITSLWAIHAQDDPSFERNFFLDVYYIENWSILLDLKILLKTIPTVLKGEGK